jgi:hypothetical protein
MNFMNERTVHQIVTQDLNMRKVCAKMVPENLNYDRKERRNEISAERLERLDTEPDFFNGVVPCGESRFFEYNSETKK